MNTFIKVNNKWQVFSDNLLVHDLKWYNWFGLRFVQLRDWFHLLGKEK